MRNPKLSLKRVQATFCSQGPRVWKKYYGPNDRPTLKQACAKLATNASDNTAYYIEVALDAFGGEPSQKDAELAVKALGAPYNYTRKKLRAYAEAQWDLANKYWDEAVFHAMSCNLSAVSAALFQNPLDNECI